MTELDIVLRFTAVFGTIFVRIDAEIYTIFLLIWEFTTVL